MAAKHTNALRADPRAFLARGLLWGTVLAGAAGLAWSLIGLRESANALAIPLVLAAAILAEVFKVSIYEARAQTLTFTLSAGKVTRLVETHSDQAAYDSFWS